LPPLHIFPGFTKGRHADLLGYVLQF
jgi:hypothetical protein